MNESITINSEDEREILQDLVTIEYNKDTTDLIEYRKKLLMLYGKLGLCKSTDRGLTKD
mgnify:CR=1 FL=1